MARVVDAVMTLPTHHNPKGSKCVSMTGTNFLTMQVGGTWYACLTTSRLESPVGAVVIMDRQEVESMIGLLQHAINDADRLNAGLEPIHTLKSTVVQ
ncbi:MAG: hypothetical protein ACRCT6_02780 [Notoacmeibacter sp.]